MIDGYRIYDADAHVNVAPQMWAAVVFGTARDKMLSDETFNDFWDEFARYKLPQPKFAEHGLRKKRCNYGCAQNSKAEQFCRRVALVRQKLAQCRPFFVGSKPRHGRPDSPLRVPDPESTFP